MDASRIAQKFDMLATRMDRTLPSKALVSSKETPSSGQNVAASMIDGYVSLDNQPSTELERDRDMRPGHVERHWGGKSVEVAEIAEDRSSMVQIASDEDGQKSSGFIAETSPDGSWAKYSLQFDVDSGAMRGVVESGQDGSPIAQQFWNIADAPSPVTPGPNATAKQKADHEQLLGQSPMIIADLLGNGY